MGKNNSNSFNTNDAEHLLKTKWNLESFEDVKQWDYRANSVISDMDAFISAYEKKLNDALNSKNEIEIKIKARPFFLRPILMWSGLAKTNRILQTGDKEINRVLDIKNQLQGWIDATPDNAVEANEIIIELKLTKKQIDINKKELQLQIKQINVDTKKKVNKIESRILFTSPKLKRLQLDRVEKKQGQNISPLEQSLLELDAQELEIDKMILWYEKIKYS